MINIDIKNKIEFILKFIYSELNLKDNMTLENYEKFSKRLLVYFEYDRRNNIFSNSLEELEGLMKLAFNRLYLLEFTNSQIIELISNYPAVFEVVGASDFVDKYALLSLCENKENNIRNNYLFKNCSKYKRDLNVIYARIKICEECERNLSISTILDNSHNEFMKSLVNRKFSFIGNQFKKINSYISEEKLINMYPIDYELINDLKNKEQNNLLYDGSINYAKQWFITIWTWFIW